MQEVTIYEFFTNFSVFYHFEHRKSREIIDKTLEINEFQRIKLKKIEQELEVHLREIDKMQQNLHNTVKKLYSFAKLQRLVVLFHDIFESFQLLLAEKPQKLRISLVFRRQFFENSEQSDQRMAINREFLDAFQEIAQVFLQFLRVFC